MKPRYKAERFPIPPNADLRIETRMFTGYPSHRAYVRDRRSGKIIAACEHLHTSHHNAVACATKILKELTV